MKSKPADDPENRLAWRVFVDDMSCIVFAMTSSRAKWVAVSSYWEAGYGWRGQWPNTRTERVPVLDKSPKRLGPQRPLCEEHAYA